MACQSCRVRKARCDKAKPTCSACAKSSRSCQYVDERKKRGPKKRNIKDLEARLNEFERRLKIEPSTEGESNGISAERQQCAEPTANSQTPTAQQFGPTETDEFAFPTCANTTNPIDYDFDDPFMGMLAPDLNFLNYEFDAAQFASQAPPVESVPSIETMNALHDIYFRTAYLFFPIIHKARYLESHPPLCLRYAVWAVASLYSSEHGAQSETYYERARKYLEEDELKGTGEAYVTLSHAQAWLMVGNYEATRGQFLAAWMSNRRAIALSCLLSLDRIDAREQGSKRALPPTDDMIDMEQRRRTFWATFCSDRWASAGHGWSMAIHEDDIATLLPVSNYAFEEGIAEETCHLAHAMTNGMNAHTSSFAAMAIAANTLAKNMLCLYRMPPSDKSTMDRILEQYRYIDDRLSQVFLTMPNHLRVFSDPQNTCSVHMQLMLQASAIAVHHAMAQKIGAGLLDESTIQRMQSRSVIAAEEIVNIVRDTASVPGERMSPFLGYPLHMAASVFLRNQEPLGISSRRVRDSLMLLVAACNKLPDSFESSKMVFDQLQTQIQRTPFKDIVIGRLRDTSKDDKRPRKGRKAFADPSSSVLGI